jgi:hypothetical protein
MKLRKLITHSALWLGVPETRVRTVAYELRPASLITSGGRGPGGAEMTVDDKINLFLGVCGVEVANRAADHVRIWRRLDRADNAEQSPHNFAFLKAKTVRDFIVDLIVEDMRDGGPLDVWLKEADAALAVAIKSDRNHVPNHRMSLDFYVDQFSLTLNVSRFVTLQDSALSELRQSHADSIEVRFVYPPSLAEQVSAQRSSEYLATSQLIRRLSEENLRGWGECLRD